MICPISIQTISKHRFGITRSCLIFNVGCHPGKHILLAPTLGNLDDKPGLIRVMNFPGLLVHAGTPRSRRCNMFKLLHWYGGFPMNTKRPLFILLIALTLLGLQFSRVLAKEVVKAGIAGPGLAGEVELSDPEELKVVSAPWFDLISASQPANLQTLAITNFTWRSERRMRSGPSTCFTITLATMTSPAISSLQSARAVQAALRHGIASAARTISPCASSWSI